MRYYKLTVNVPESHADVVRDAIGKAGGGHVGQYSHCSFSVKGKGRFMPMDDANPYIGSCGNIECVEEESLHIHPIAEDNLKKVVEALIETHPYEETNYYLEEIFTLETLK